MPQHTRAAVLALLVMACSDGQEPSPPSRIGSIRFVPDSIRIDVGGVYRAFPEARDTAGIPLFDVSYTWRSADPEVATVDGTGQIRGVALGTTELEASAEGLTGRAVVLVVPSSLATLRLTPADAHLLPGSAVQVVAEFRDTSGQLAGVPDSEVVWSSSDSAIAIVRLPENTVGPTRAVVTALRTGQAALTARRGALSASIAVTIAPERFRTVIAGGSHVCAVTASDQTYCWGGNTDGQLGGGYPDLLCGERVYCSDAPLLVHGSHRFAGLSLGTVQSCGLTEDARLFCWGGGLINDMRGGAGCVAPELDPVVGCIPEPDSVELESSASSASAGGDHACALDVAGTIRCWGDARQNRLGISADSVPRFCTQPVAGSVDEFPCSPDPIRISDPGPFKALAAGSYHTCALTLEGEAHCWGWNTSGQLARDSVSQGELPGPVTGTLRFEQITAGGDHTCGLAAGEAWCWGSNRFGELGSLIETSCSSTEAAACDPVPIAGHEFTDLDAGGYHTCGIDRSGAAWCWGYNASGQLGDGTTTLSATPVAVSGGLTFTSISAGGGNTCAMATDGVAYCWGSGRGIGDGGPDRGVPTKVAGQP